MNKIQDRILEKASRARVPIMCSFELLPVCILRCKMCYVRKSMDYVRGHGGLKDAEWWLDLAREGAAHGLLYPLLTGGEPFLHPEFDKILAGMPDMGLLLLSQPHPSAACHGAGADHGPVHGPVQRHRSWHHHHRLPRDCMEGFAPTLPDTVVGVLADGTLAGEFAVDWDAPAGDAGKVFTGIISLNEIGRFLFEALREEQTEDSLVQAVLDQYEVDPGTALADVREFLEHLRRANLSIE